MGGQGGSGGGNPMQAKVDEFLNSPQAAAYANDPVMGPVLADVKANGAQAATKYLSNPEVMSKLMNLLPK